MPWRICRNEFAERMFALFVRHNMEIFQSFELINEVSVWRPMGLPLIGAHHAGIEVLGAEYSYGPPGIEIGSQWTSEVAMGALDSACYSGFWFHYHSQKVIGCQGFKMLKWLVCGHVTTTKCSLNGLFHDEMVRIIWLIKTWHEWRWTWGQVVVSIFFFDPYLGKWSILTSIFFKWVGSTTNQLTWTGIMQDEGNTYSTPLAIILDLQAWAA